MKADDLTIKIKCKGADKASRELSRIGFKLFHIRLGLLDKEIPDEKLRRKRKLELIKEYKKSKIEHNEKIEKLRNAKGMNEFQKVSEESARKRGRNE